MDVATKHTRVQESLLRRPERRVLLWLARHMPDQVKPDHLTALGVLGAACVLLGFALSSIHPAYLWLAVLGFVLNWFGDSLDGTLARYRKHERPRYGFFIDHTIDVVDEMLMFLGIGLSPFADFRVAALALISYMALSTLAYINMIVNQEFRISASKIGPTEVRVVGIAASIALYLFGCPQVIVPLIGAVTWLDVLLALISLVFLALMASEGARIGSRLAKMEP